MKNIAWTVMVCLGVAGLAGCTTSSKPNVAANPAVASTTVASNTAPAAQILTGTNLLSDEKARVSYAIGMTFAQNFKMQGVEVDPDLLIRGLKDSESGGMTLLTVQEMHDTLNQFQNELMAKQQKMREAIGVTNKAEGEAFFATNKNNPGVLTLPDGVQYIVITNGTGAVPASNDMVNVIYRGTLLDSTVFDDSRGRPRKLPITSGIPGWVEALSHMKVGSRWKIFIPSDLAYGERGRPTRIMPNSALIFDVELVSTEQPKPPEPLTSDILKVPSLEEMKKGAKVEIIKPEDAAKAQATPAAPPANDQPAK